MIRFLKWLRLIQGTLPIQAVAYSISRKKWIQAGDQERPIWIWEFFRDKYEIELCRKIIHNLSVDSHAVDSKPSFRVLAEIETMPEAKKTCLRTMQLNREIVRAKNGDKSNVNPVTIWTRILTDVLNHNLKSIHQGDVQGEESIRDKFRNLLEHNGYNLISIQFVYKPVAVE